MKANNKLGAEKPGKFIFVLQNIKKNSMQE